MQSQIYGTRNFKQLFPSDDWPIGKPYYIIKDTTDFTPMNRYHPTSPPVNSLLHSILAQFHPNVFLVTRFGPRGTVGIIRAKSDNLIDIIFRYVFCDA